MLKRLRLVALLVLAVGCAGPAALSGCTSEEVLDDTLDIMLDLCEECETDLDGADVCSNCGYNWRTGETHGASGGSSTYSDTDDGY